MCILSICVFIMIMNCYSWFHFPLFLSMVCKEMCFINLYHLQSMFPEFYAMLKVHSQHVNNSNTILSQFIKPSKPILSTTNPGYHFLHFIGQHRNIHFIHGNQAQAIAASINLQTVSNSSDRLLLPVHFY